MVLLTSHSIKFVRSGKCVQCGACGCGDCSHHLEWDNKHWCAVYESRNLVCWCSHPDNDGTHSNCIGFPDNPWIGVVRHGICGYSFERADGGSMDDLPFLNSEPYKLD